MSSLSAALQCYGACQPCNHGNGAPTYAGCTAVAVAGALMTGAGFLLFIVDKSFATGASSGSLGLL